MAENIPEKSKIYGFANFDYFLTRYADKNIYIKYAQGNDDLSNLLIKIALYDETSVQKYIAFLSKLYNFKIRNKKARSSYFYSKISNY